MGAGVLNIEEAVFKVLNDKRLAQGKEPFTKETLLGLSTLELTAIGGSDTGERFEYTITADLGVVGEGGTDVVIEVSGDHALSGATTKHLASAGGVSWQVSIPEPGNYLKVTRSDSGAGAWLILAGDDTPLNPLKTLELDDPYLDVTKIVDSPHLWIEYAFYHGTPDSGRRQARRLHRPQVRRGEGRGLMPGQLVPRGRGKRPDAPEAFSPGAVRP
jgi:hypothetical protein